MIRSFLNIAASGSKVRTENVLTAEILMPIANYAGIPERLVAMRALMPQLQQLPGLHAYPAATSLPLNNGSWTRSVKATDAEQKEGVDGPSANYVACTPGYFSVIGPSTPSFCSASVAFT